MKEKLSWLQKEIDSSEKNSVQSQSKVATPLSTQPSDKLDSYDQSANKQTQARRSKQFNFTNQVKFQEEACFSSFNALKFDKDASSTPASEQVLESPFDQYLYANAGGRELLYQAKLCDQVDYMMARFLNSDPVGKKLKLPVIRLSKEVYLIGLCKSEVQLNDNFRLMVKGPNSNRSAPLKQMLINTQ